jgi:hypothetical protein
MGVYRTTKLQPVPITLPLIMATRAATHFANLPIQEGRMVAMSALRCLYETED